MDSATWESEYDYAGAGLALADGQTNEDWEEWLRWDPSVDTATSPDDGTVGSGSSKHDSPIQDTVLPVGAGMSFSKDDTLAPPVIVGHDGLDYPSSIVADDVQLLFGDSNSAAIPPDFDFQPIPPDQLLTPVDTASSLWPLLGGNAPNLDFAASTEPYQPVPPSATVPSNTPSLHHSPESSTRNRSSVSSGSPEPPPKKRGGRKRKADHGREMAEQNGDSNEDGDGDGDGDGDEPPMKKTSHNVIEKRYRNNLNDKIVELRNSVPSLRALGRANNGKTSEDLEGLTPAHKLNKATVMAKATEYIRHLERRNKGMADEMATLKARLAAVEAAIGKSTDRQNSVTAQIGSQPFLNPSQEQPRFTQQTSQQPFSRSGSYSSYQSQQTASSETQQPPQPQTSKSRGRSNVMNKTMLGAMAGLMVMEGFTEQHAENNQPRGLSAVPSYLFKRDSWSSASGPIEIRSTQAIIPLLKTFLVISALLYVLAPLLTFSPRRKQKTRPAVVRLPHAPSLASPIELRRKAWLTAIQVVWVPKHFLLEVVAVTVKMIGLSVRRLIGSEAYNNLTGSTREEESARIKAWDIAIDAQLAGGDAEVSYYRLLLTLMESGTLPDSPTRLMQKAVHFRVFFWEVANAGYGNMIGFKRFTQHVGKIYWDSARRQQRELAHAAAQGRPRDNHEDEDVTELLPDHLASLVEHDCDEVLSDEMIQRAWNLAWNKPSAYRTSSNADRDAVVEDHTIRSPLDAVAAWYANMIIDETLVKSISEKPRQIDTEYHMGLAVAIAPRASATQARALAAKAVLSNRNREKNVLTALDALPLDPPRAGGTMNVVTHLPVAPDIRTALTLAKLLSLTSPSASPTAYAHALRSMAKIDFPLPCAFTLLTAVAAYRLLKVLVTESRGRPLPIHAKLGVENLAANLRVWIGTSTGRSAGLLRDDRGRIADLCISVAKQVGGWSAERDSGYGSADVSPVRARSEATAV